MVPFDHTIIGRRVARIVNVNLQHRSQAIVRTAGPNLLKGLVRTTVKVEVLSLNVLHRAGRGHVNYVVALHTETRLNRRLRARTILEGDTNRVLRSTPKLAGRCRDRVGLALLRHNRERLRPCALGNRVFQLGPVERDRHRGHIQRRGSLRDAQRYATVRGNIHGIIARAHRGA